MFLFTVSSNDQLSSTKIRFTDLYLTFATPKQQMFAVLDTIPYLFKR